MTDRHKVTAELKAISWLSGIFGGEHRVPLIFYNFLRSISAFVQYRRAVSAVMRPER